MLLWKPQHNPGFPSFCLFIFYKHWPLPTPSGGLAACKNQFIFFFLMSTSLCKYIFWYIASHNITATASKFFFFFFCNKCCIICYPLGNSAPRHLALCLGWKSEKSLMVIKLNLLGLHSGRNHTCNLSSPRVSNVHLPWLCFSTCKDLSHSWHCRCLLPNCNSSAHDFPCRKWDQTQKAT